MGSIEQKSRILVFGGTGYIGNFIVKACVAAGHPTYVYVRPMKPDHNPSKLDVLNEYKSLGVTIFEGELDEHEKLVDVLRQVDIVIVTLAIPQCHEQHKIIEAMKEAGNIKRFIPSEFGNDVDRISPLPPFQEGVCKIKKGVRRAAEKSGIPYTFVSSNSCGAYFVNFLLRPSDEKLRKVTVYGTGEAKFPLNYEKDIAEYTLRLATDPRAANSLVFYRPPKNIVSQLDLISSWEKKTGRTLEKTYVSEEEIIKLSQTASTVQDAVGTSILHSIFVKGEQMNFELKEDELEVSKLYPDYKYTSVDELLDIFLVDPPKPASAAFG
uniref:T-anol/isoeugenol synthase n=1 Tax=Pimpinella anisum TaxID=271192 RepID=B8RCD2_PIMAN|nr:t-anol/isoeugenol synthase [Pimpinella anisum]